MMATTGKESATDAKEIHRLVASACQQGKPDRYTGKRRWMRFSAGMRLEITFDPAKSDGSWHVTMQNVSEGGFAFWSKRELFEHTPIFVREFSVEGDREWIGGHVRHCTVGIRGFLVGAEFENPPSEPQFPEAHAKPAEPRPPTMRTPTGRKITLPPPRPRPGGNPLQPPRR